METPSRRGTKLCIAPIEIVTETDNFSLNFDNRLIFVPQFEMHKNMCLMALINLKYVNSTVWDAHSTILLNIWRSLIRSKLDYKYIVY